MDARISRVVTEILEANPDLGRRRLVAHVTRKLGVDADDALEEAIAEAARLARGRVRNRRNRRLGGFALILGLLLTAGAATGLVAGWTHRSDWALVGVRALAMMLILGILFLGGVALCAHALRSALRGYELPDGLASFVFFTTRPPHQAPDRPESEKRRRRGGRPRPTP